MAERLASQLVSSFVAAEATGKNDYTAAWGKGQYSSNVVEAAATRLNDAGWLVRYGERRDANVAYGFGMMIQRRPTLDEYIDEEKRADTMLTISSLFRGTIALLITCWLVGSHYDWVSCVAETLSTLFVLFAVGNACTLRSSYRAIEQELRTEGKQWKPVRCHWINNILVSGAI